MTDMRAFRRSVWLRVQFLVIALVFVPAAWAVTPACCAVTAIDARSASVTAKENASGRLFQFHVANAALLRSLRIGAPVYANFSRKQVSLDARSACCTITSVGSAPVAVRTRPAAPTSAARTSATPAAHRVSNELRLVSIGVSSPPSENVRGEADPSPRQAFRRVALQPMGMRQQRLVDSAEGRKLIEQGAKLLAGITMHASLLGGHKYMVNNCLGIKASAGNFDLRIPDPDVRFENNAVRISFVITRISMNALSVRLRPDVGDPLNPCTFSSRIGIGGYAENIRYDITFDPVQDLEACRLGSMGKVAFQYSVGKVRLEPLPPEVGNVAKGLINDALMFISSNTDLNLVDEEMLLLNRLLAQKCPEKKLAH